MVSALGSGEGEGGEPREIPGMAHPPVPQGPFTHPQISWPLPGSQAQGPLVRKSLPTSSLSPPGPVQSLSPQMDRYHLASH